jgi:hypothetical protein
MSIVKDTIQEKPSALKGEHPALSEYESPFLFYFCGNFCRIQIPIPIEDSDTDTDDQPMGIHADPDPLH